MILYLLQLLLLVALSPSISYERESPDGPYSGSSSHNTYSQLMKDHYEDEGISDLEYNHTIIFAIKHDEDTLIALGKKEIVILSNL